MSAKKTALVALNIAIGAFFCALSPWAGLPSIAGALTIALMPEKYV